MSSNRSRALNDGRESNRVGRAGPSGIISVSAQTTPYNQVGIGETSGNLVGGWAQTAASRTLRRRLTPSSTLSGHSQTHHPLAHASDKDPRRQSGLGIVRWSKVELHLKHGINVLLAAAYPPPGPSRFLRSRGGRHLRSVPGLLASHHLPARDAPPSSRHVEPVHGAARWFRELDGMVDGIREKNYNVSRRRW